MKNKIWLNIIIFLIIISASTIVNATTCKVQDLVVKKTSKNSEDSNDPQNKYDYFTDIILDVSDGKVFGGSFKIYYSDNELETKKLENSEDLAFDEEENSTGFESSLNLNGIVWSSGESGITGKNVLLFKLYFNAVGEPKENPEDYNVYIDFNDGYSKIVDENNKVILGRSDTFSQKNKNVLGMINENKDNNSTGDTDKPTGDNDKLTVNNSKPNTNNQIKDSNTQKNTSTTSTTKNNSQVKNADKTNYNSKPDVSTKILPAAGANFRVIIIISMLIAIAVFSYKKYKELKY